MSANSAGFRKTACRTGQSGNDVGGFFGGFFLAGSENSLFSQLIILRHEKLLSIDPDGIQCDGMLILQGAGRTWHTVMPRTHNAFYRIRTLGFDASVTGTDFWISAGEANENPAVFENNACVSEGRVVIQSRLFDPISP